MLLVKSSGSKEIKKSPLTNGTINQNNILESIKNVSQAHKIIYLLLFFTQKNEQTIDFKAKITSCQKLKL